MVSSKSKRRYVIWIGCLIAASPVSTAFAQQTQNAADLEFFEKKVRPVLVNRCYACHSAETKPAGGLRVDDRNGLLTGGNGGPAIIPGDPDGGSLIQRILHEDPKLKMPKEGAPFTPQELADLRKWIADGVAWPSEKVPAAPAHLEPMYEKLRARHWSLQPRRDAKPPSVQNTAWVNSEIDHFILAKLEEKKLTPVKDADRLTLIRRVTFDLTGLPPTPEEIRAFTEDKSKDAYARLVDRLLSSSRYGERWGRHWLDVARYAESTGPSRNVPYPHAWKYRDYVLDSINRDVPFHQFIQEQVAGDLLKVSEGEKDRALIATGFLALGPKDVNQRFKERFLMDNVDEQVDTVTRSVLGLTVSCARCHDHKFDPIPAKDYYSIAGIFTSTDQLSGVVNKMGGSGLEYYRPELLVHLGKGLPSVDAEQVKRLKADVAAAQKAWNEIRGTARGLALAADGKPTQRPYRLKLEKLQAEYLKLTDPAEYGLAAHGLKEGRIADTSLRIRGEAERLGPVVARGFLTAFKVADAPEINPQQSGRLEFAQWLTSPNNPLTARVIVNRIWHHLFGQGIVCTVDNFGANGDRPSHPELLDYLANTFVQEGWSQKKLIRRIVLSHAYRLGSDEPQEYREIDPSNRLVWRHSPRRLEAEEIRDAMLAASGQLNLQPIEGSPAQKFKMIEMPDNGPESRTIHQKANENQHRSIYLPLLRGVIPQSLEAFDPVTQTLVTGQRETTTVPTQALYLLNSTFVRNQSLEFAGKLLSASATEKNAERIQRAYELTLGRKPTPLETDRAQTFLADFEKLYPALAAAQQAGEKSVKGQTLKDRVDQADQTDAERNAQVVLDEQIHPQDAQHAAWMNFVQALYASAEFRFVR